MPRVFELDLYLHNVTPRIWRRVRLPGDLSLADLHRVIQVLMHWDDKHLHLFEVGGREYSPEPEEDWERESMELENWAGSDDALTVAQAFADSQRISYEYDFGDEWRVEIDVVSDAARTPAHVECVSGELAGPPEDVGGASAYQALLDVWTTQGKSGLPKEQRDWLPRGFDPMVFDVKDANRRLEREFRGTAAAPPAKVTPEEQLLADVTLLLLFLGSWEEGKGVRVARKSVRVEMLDVLSDAGLLVTNPHRQSVVLTAEGVRRAEALRTRVAEVIGA